MPRYMLVMSAKGVSVPNPHAERRYVGKPNTTTPVWAPGEEPVAEVVLDEAALRKAARKGDLRLLGETVSDNIEAARAVLQPAPPVKPGKDK